MGGEAGDPPSPPAAGDGSQPHLSLLELVGTRSGFGFLPRGLGGGFSAARQGEEGEQEPWQVLVETSGRCSAQKQTPELQEHPCHAPSSLPREPAAARLWQVKSPGCYLASPTWLPAPLRLFHRHVGVRVGVGVRLGHVHGCVSHFRVRVHFGIRIGAGGHFLRAQSGVGCGEREQLLPLTQRHGAQTGHRDTSKLSSSSGPPPARSRAHPDPASLQGLPAASSLAPRGEQRSPKQQPRGQGTAGGRLPSSSCPLQASSGEPWPLASSRE